MPLAPVILTAEQFGCLLTKDYLKDYLDEKLKDFVTKDYFEKTLDERFDERLKNVATKDDFKNFATKDDLKNFPTKSDFKLLERKVQSLDEKVDSIDKKLDDRFGQLDYKIETVFNYLQRSFDNHELRLKRLEARVF